MDASQAKKLLVHVLLVIHREQTGSAKTAVEQGSEGKLTPQLLDNVRTITAVLKVWHTMIWRSPNCSHGFVTALSVV